MRRRWMIPVGLLLFVYLIAYKISTDLHQLHLSFRCDTTACHLTFGDVKPLKFDGDRRTNDSSQLAGLQSASRWSSPPVATSPVRVVLYWTARKISSPKFGLGRAPFAGCPVSNCWVTDDRTQLAWADAVLFRGSGVNSSDLPSERRPQQHFVLVHRESQLYTSGNLRSLDAFFTMTMTYHRGADLRYPYGQIVPGKQPGALPYFHRRRRAAAWLVSHCSTKSKREQYVARLRRRLAVDQYGACGGRPRCSSPRPDCYSRMAASHFFYLAFENSLCEDYITEKFWLALRTGMVPVVRGADPDSYRRVAPPHSFIHVQDFSGPDSLADYLGSLMQNRTAYGSYLAWRGRYRVGGGRVMCDLCAKIAQQEQIKTVMMSEVWSVEKHCVG